MCICSCSSKNYVYAFILLLLSLLDTLRRCVLLSLGCLLMSTLERYVSPSSSVVFLNFLYFLSLAHLDITYRCPQGAYIGLHLRVTVTSPYNVIGNDENIIGQTFIIYNLVPEPFQKMTFRSLYQQNQQNKVLNRAESRSKTVEI